MVPLKKQTKADAGEDIGRKEPSYTVGGNTNWCNLHGNQYGGSPQNKQIKIIELP
jgi:hypothetical protein